MWGFAKKILRQMPFERRKELSNFVTEVKASVSAVDPVRMRRFRRRCRKYMRAYDAIVGQYAADNGIEKTAEEAMTAATSHHAIKDFVKAFGHKNKKQQQPRKKRNAGMQKKLAGEEFSEEERKLWLGTKRRDSRPTPAKTAAAPPESQEAKLNPPIDIESQEQIYTAHRGADSTDARYLNTKVDYFLA
jgi:ATPase subunit of ABC transporter with duplicated ATPase domains